MSDLFQDIRTGLEEAIAYERGQLTGATVRRTTIIAPPSYTAEEIKAIRKNAELTQKAFASCIGVSVKTVEAWECGRNHPDGAARRMISLFEGNPHFAEASGIMYNTVEDDKNA